MKISAEQIAAGTGASIARATRWLDAINDACEKYQINTPKRIAAFLAQIGHESGYLVYVREIWGPTPAQVRYEGRRDLGNTQLGDGKRFLGRGLIQVTGRDNYRQATDGIRKQFPAAPDFVANPTALEQTPWAAVSAAWFWDSRNLNALADKDDFVGLTRRINGGTNGMADRQRLWDAAKKVLS